MAIGDAYATAALYKTQRDKDGAGDDTALARELIAVSRYIDQVTGQSAGFNVDASDVTRVYVAPGGSPTRWDWAESENPWLYGGVKRVLEIDPMVSATTIEVDESKTGSYDLTLAATDYELLPRNASKGPEAKPYRQIELTSWGDVVAWPAGSNVRITGKFGWPAVPSAIVSATIELTAIFRMESGRATSRVNEVGTVINTSAAGQSIVRELVRAYANPAAVYV